MRIHNSCYRDINLLKRPILKAKHLILVRHAKSSWNSDATTDFDRPLNKRGQHDIPRMGKWLKKNHFIPELIVSSPAERARQTALVISKHLEVSRNDLIWVDELYGAGLDNLLSVIATYAVDISCLLLVAHNPGLDQLLCHLSMDEPGLTSDGKLMTTAAAAVLTYENSSISTEPASAHLKELIRPKQLGSSD